MQSILTIIIPLIPWVGRVVKAIRIRVSKVSCSDFSFLVEKKIGVLSTIKFLSYFSTKYASIQSTFLSLGGHGAKGSYLNNVLIIRYDFLPFLPLSVSYKFLKIIIGSALSALEGKNPEIGEKSVFKLLETLDNYFKIPKREVTHETIFAVEKVYNIEGGVVTGKLEQGSVKKGDKLVIAGQGKNKTTIVNGLETFCKTVDKGEPGDQLGIRYFLFFLNWVFGDRLIFACGGSNKM
ncbi:unnamed protein product [Meloidogyne enterolobii]|uniref:Uncharacterized protein n=1 Tax=Meloidogyne enterolobii TaxID=390850 RepID=A0ACB1ANV8_MELEN